ncbi:MAG: methylenetetrahydrofolate reductase [Ilumatobacteraceae bacterium]
MTYGAGGGTRQRTHDVVSWVRKETGITPMAHLTCQGHTRDDPCDPRSVPGCGIGVNILALAGDPPTDPADACPSDYAHASELVDDIDHEQAFRSVSPPIPRCTPFPGPGHGPQAPGGQAAAGRTSPSPSSSSRSDTTSAWSTSSPNSCEKPVLLDYAGDQSGVDPAHGVAVRCRGSPVGRAPGAFGDDAEAVRRAGVEAAIELCAALLDAGAPGCTSTR